MTKIYIYTDGGARGNPGPAAIGVVIKDESNNTIHTISRRIGETTNNVAEYEAVVAGLEWIKENLPKIIDNNQQLTVNSQQLTENKQQINFFIDSTLIVNQLNGYFKIKNGNLRNYLYKVRELEQEIRLPVYYSQIPREKNREADFLVNKALDSL